MAAEPAVLLGPVFVFLSYLFGGGLPLGMPPLPEDPTMAAAAPEKCLVYLSSAGVATPKPESGNQTEQLLAEPEVRRVLVQIQRAIEASLAREMKKQEAPERPSAGEVVELAKLPLTRPIALYLSSFRMGMRGPVPGSLRAGAVVNLGDDLDKTKAAIEQLAERLPPALLDSVTIAGQSWQRFRPAPGVTVVWGFKDKHLWLGIGEGELEAMLQRAEGKPPAWLAQLRRDLTVERPSNVTYINLKMVKELAVSGSGGLPGSGGFWGLGHLAGEVIDALGLGNLTAFQAVAGLDREGFVSRAQLAIDGRPEGLMRLIDGRRSPRPIWQPSRATPRSRLS